MTGVQTCALPIYLSLNRPDFVIIGWPTWERAEFLDESTNTYWQVNAGGIGEDWPNWLKNLYPKWLMELDIKEKTRQAHEHIYELHEFLQQQEIAHIFFNTYTHFDKNLVAIHDWADCFLDPYTQNGTYSEWCVRNGFRTVNTNSYHFGADAHRAWADYLLPHVQRLLTTKS